MNDSVLEVLVCAASFAARGVLSFELRAPDGSDLPAFTAGSHIDLHLPNGLIRSYSLVNSPSERHRYVIAVSLDPNSRGGSRYLFEYQLVGQFIKIGKPRNNFSLVEDADSVVLIAGGIGITPLHSMILRLEALGKRWALYYGARDRASAAFRQELEALEAAHPGRVHFNFDQEQGAMLDVERVVAAAPADAHLYCCGPLPMLNIFKAAAAGRPSDTVHIEYFAAPSVAAPSKEAFTVVVSSTGQAYEVGVEESILDVLLRNGVNAASSCRSGECGSCLVNVLEGEPHHKDFVLSENERAANRLMAICVSGSKSKKLVIDL
jgi:vanillate O-demethylase ferredoxin subunit